MEFKLTLSIKNFLFIYFIIFINYCYISCEDDENIEIVTLESDSTELLDVTDNHNLNLIVTTSKKIYTGIPPTQKTTTVAQIINATSVISISEYYLLAACLQDTLLAKISLSDGSTDSILGYSDVDSNLNLPVPITSCSLSIRENTVIIGYSKIEYLETDTNKTNIIIRLEIVNKEDTDGPSLGDTSKIKFYTFPESSQKTNSPRQISCEPVLLNSYSSTKHNCSNFRVVCAFELYDKAGSKNQYYTYAVPINDDFTGLEIDLRGKRIKQLETYSGFRLYKYNDTTLRCVIKYSVYDITIKINDKSVVSLSWTDKSYLLNSEADLFDYNNEFFFKSQKVDDIYSLQIYQPSITNYLTLNNYNENSIKKLMGYHIGTSTEEDNTIFIYQSPTHIKYFQLNSGQTFSEELTIEIICDENEAKLRYPNDHKCYSITQLIKGYKYEIETNYFERCYTTCSFCSENSTDSSNHKCESCADDYLPSYKYTKNCYNKNGLEESADKIVENQNDTNFVTTTCSSYKIESTGECVETCPETTDYYLYEYDSTTEQYTKSNLNPPKYKFNKKCIEACPSNSISDDNNVCKCQYAFYVLNDETTCLSDNNCIDEYPYQNPDTKECYSSLNDCLDKGNNYFFNQYCYTNNCPSDKNDLNSKSDDIKNYFISKLSITDDNIKNKLCICDITNGVWSDGNSNSNNVLYYQECLNQCPDKYEPEEVTKYCIEKNDTSISTEESTLESNTVESTTEESTTEELKTEREIIIPNEQPDNCFVLYEGKCYVNCPDGTCLPQNNIDLKNCVPIKGNTQVFNNICFENLDEITKNIKSMSDNDELITNPSGIIIHGYSTNSDNNDIDDIDPDVTYSIVDLGDCENKLKEHYNLDDSIELYILGIDSQ